MWATCQPAVAKTVLHVLIATRKLMSLRERFNSLACIIRGLKTAKASPLLLLDFMEWSYCLQVLIL